jgi:hypothetical protein
MALIFHSLGYQDLIRGSERDEADIVSKMQHMKEIEQPKLVKIGGNISNKLPEKVNELDTYFNRFVLDTDNLVQTGNFYLKFRGLLLDYCELIKPIDDIDYLKTNRTKLVMTADELNKLAPSAEYLFNRAGINLFQPLINELKELNKIVYINYIVHV